MNGDYCVTCRVWSQEGTLFAALCAAGCGVHLLCKHAVRLSELAHLNQTKDALYCKFEYWLRSETGPGQFPIQSDRVRFSVSIWTGTFSTVNPLCRDMMISVNPLYHDVFCSEGSRWFV